MFAPAWKMGVSHILQSGNEEDGLKSSDNRGEVGYFTIAALDNKFFSNIYIYMYVSIPSLPQLTLRQLSRCKKFQPGHGKLL